MRKSVHGDQGSYGRLNDILIEKNESERKKKIQAYAREDAAAAQIFTKEQA